MLRIVSIAFATFLFFGSAWAEDPEDPQTTGGEEPWVQSISPSDPVIEARVVFIAFPDEPSRQDLPSWAGDLTNHLNDFIQTMSHGAQQFNFSVVTRPAAPGKAWIANFGESHYGGNYGELNREVMEQISQTYLPTNAWSGVEFVFTVQYRCVFDPDCGVGGWSCLCLTGSVTGFSGSGSTQRLFDDVGVPVNASAQLNLVEWVSAQEYAHNLGWGHSPHSETWNVPVVNYGRYDGMSGNASLRYIQGNTPYQALWLVKANWLPQVTITTDTRDLHVPDTRSAAGKAYRVDVPTQPNSYQYFVFANHQGLASSVYDEKYTGRGLLIWHALRTTPSPPNDLGSNALAWDLESGDGKFANGWPGGVPSGSPDPVSGTDRLEFDLAWKGSSGDFFNNSGGVVSGQPVHADFSYTTNPNTNAYSAASFLSPQSVQTSIALENIRKDVASSDMIVDVYVDPKQYVFYPNGGEYIPKGAASGVIWNQRPKAGISSVDILLSQDGGVTYSTLASGQPNTTAYPWSPTVVGSQYKFKVRSYDAIANASDESDATFNVWGIDEPTIWTVVSYSCDSPTITFDVSWATSVETDGSDVLEVYAPNQSTPSSQSAASQGTQHRVIWHGSCQANATVPWTYRVKSIKSGGVTASALKTKLVTQCASCPPPCNPPCELE